MKILNATKGTMNLPLPNGSRLIIEAGKVSKQFYPTIDLLTLLVSAYSRDDIGVIIDNPAEIAMGATVSALPGYVYNTPEEAIASLKKEVKCNNEEVKLVKLVKKESKPSTSNEPITDTIVK